jgi:aryl-alcohol dehydrogenase-like predicted oxidoreductase
MPASVIDAMIYRPLGRTGLMVSAISVGTVSLGLDYGITAPDEYGRPAAADAVRLLHEAAAAGVNLFDTAPSYGDSENLLGEALHSSPQCYIATKVAVPQQPDGEPLRGVAVRRVIEQSLHQSLRSLRRDTLDIVQIHNATVAVLEQGDVAEVLLDAQRRGLVRFLGASIYGEAAALAAIRVGCIDVLQVAYNVLDQRMAARVFPAAAAAGVAILVRSALLKGALTGKAQWLPPELAPLRRAAERARAWAKKWDSLPLHAVRFCMSAPEVASVLVGTRTLHELSHGLTAARLGPLDDAMLGRASALAIDEERLLNPSYWPVA